MFQDFPARAFNMKKIPSAPVRIMTPKTFENPKFFGEAYCPNPFAKKNLFFPGLQRKDLRSQAASRPGNKKASLRGVQAFMKAGWFQIPQQGLCLVLCRGPGDRGRTAIDPPRCQYNSPLGYHSGHCFM
jgi:hypothetical protein